MLGFKKKERPIINNINNTNFEIDYEKLANAFVKAYGESEKISEANNKFYTLVMRVFNWFLYFIIYTISGYCFYVMLGISTDNKEEVFAKVFFLLVFGVITIVMFSLQFELIKSSPKQVREQFNSSVSFVALILAVFALLPNKDVENIEVLLQEIKSIIENIGIAK